MAPKLDEFARYNPDWAKELVAGHHQCDECGKITAGPFKEEAEAPPRYPPHMEHIDAEGHVYSQDEAEKRGLPYNISTGKCPKCYEKWARGMARSVNWRGTVREWQEAKRKFDETTTKGKQSFDETVDRSKQSFEDTVNSGKQAFDETVTRDAPESQED